MSTKNSPHKFKILLDQNFPKPKGFAIDELDHSISVTHLSDAAPDLVKRSTPDWYVYCIAAQEEFDVLVTGDISQRDQIEEMWVLSRLPRLSIVTWRKGTNDPLQLWGQLLAYMPQIKQRCSERGGRVLMLPAPTLQGDSLIAASDRIGIQASDQGIATQEIHTRAREHIVEWLTSNGEPPDTFNDVLRIS